MAEGNFVPNGDGSWSQQVVQTGRNVEKIIAFNAFAITDTATKITVSDTDLSKYKEVAIYVLNTHNQAVTVIVYDRETGSTVGTGVSVSVAAGAGIRITPNANTGMSGGFKTVRIGALAATAPTSGSITVFIYGTPN